MALVPAALVLYKVQVVGVHDALLGEAFLTLACQVPVRRCQTLEDLGLGGVRYLEDSCVATKFWRHRTNSCYVWQVLGNLVGYLALHKA